jgi:hypothetical protein
MSFFVKIIRKFSVRRSVIEMEPVSRPVVPVSVKPKEQAKHSDIVVADLHNCAVLGRAGDYKKVTYLTPDTKLSNVSKINTIQAWSQHGKHIVLLAT